MAKRLLFVLLIGLGGLPAFAQPAPDPLQQSISAVKGLLEKRPDDPTVYYYLASFQAQAKQRDQALASLAKVLELGDGFLPGNQFGFENLERDPDFITLRATFENRLPVVDNAPVAFRIDDTAFGPEGIAYDPASKSFFVGSVSQKRIDRISQSGKITPFASDGLEHVLGVLVDSKRRRLHAVSTNVLSHGTPRYNAIVSFDLKTGKRIRAVAVPGARQLNDVALAPNGDLYASDSAAGAVWRIAAATPEPVAFVSAGTLGGSNGLAVSADGKMLYVGHSTGVARVDTASGAIERVVPPARETIAAIDGLYLWHGDLIGIQNITTPGRVIRMRMNKAGTEIVSVDTLQSHHNRAFDEPTTAAIAGDGLYVLATTQLPNYNAKGEVARVANPKKPAIVRIILPKN